MYGHKARATLIALLKEAPELKVGEPPKPVVTPKGYAKIADRLLIELWMHGFAVSARKVGAKPPKGASDDHKGWRDAKLAPVLARAERRRQRDVEGQPSPPRSDEGQPSKAAPAARGAVPQSS
jgi:hypothetical protein